MLRAISLCLLLLTCVESYAQAPAMPEQTDSVVLETYLYYFSIKDVVQQCITLLPDQKVNFSNAFTTWEARNKNDLAFVNAAFNKYYASKPKDKAELIAAMPSIVQSQQPVYDEALCKVMMKTIESDDLEDYQPKFEEHFEILKTRLKIPYPRVWKK